jgi:hypothetical protein
MGDKAEAAFLLVNPYAHRLGLNRPLFSMRDMAATMRYTPDFMLADGVYEVMGCASRGGGSIKPKTEKLHALSEWSKIMPVHIWAYDSSKQRYWVAPLGSWWSAVTNFGVIGHFPDNGKEYFALDIKHFPGDPSPIPG